MASNDFSAAPTAPAHPQANPGFGKRGAPGQSPRRRNDFAHLPRREAAIAAYLDRLPEGAAVDGKTLARVLPDYGQMACLSALAALTTAGHLRRVREKAEGPGTRWVTRTYFSRTARDDAWWAAFRAGEATPPVQPDEGPPPGPARSEAYDVLAELGRADPRMTLSAAECGALEDLAARWLTLGATKAQLVGALTAGLPERVHSPGALARKRLTAKMPPEPARPRARTAVPLAECAVCRVPGRPEALPGGLCRTCRGESPHRPTGLAPAEVRARVARLRATTHPPQERLTKSKY